MDHAAEERARAEARNRLRSRATREERDDFLRRLDELTGGPPAPELIQWAEEFLNTPPETGVAHHQIARTHLDGTDEDWQLSPYLSAM